MPITAADIKLFASERMTDTSDGGGRRTSNVIPDGEPGNIFPKVSRLDGVYGRVNLRKVSAGVETPTVETYAGAHAVIMDAPDNDKIHVNLFSTGSDFDTRTQARDRIESYVIAGPESRMIVYGRQLIGQRAVMAYQREEEPLPEVGEVFCLSRETAGVVEYQQYVRVEDVEHEVRSFADSLASGEFKRRVVTMALSSPLRYEFPGHDAPLRFANETRPTLIRRTKAADTSRYCGIQPVTEAAPANALAIKVASVYSPIVPTTQRETAISSAQISGASSLLPAGSERMPYMPTGPSLSPFISTVREVTCRLPTAIAPGTLNVMLVSDGNVSPSSNSNVGTDDGKGNIIPPTPQSGGSKLWGGTVDYQSGTMVLSVQWQNPMYGGHVEAAYILAADVSQPAHTRELPVTLATRGTVFVQSLIPIPAPGTLNFDFRALGKWYRLRDDGTGAVRGDDPAYGVGTIDYVTGALVATIGALPDVGSSVLLAWGSKVHYTIRAGATSDAGTRVKQRIQLTALPVKPGTVAVEYPVAGVPLMGLADVNGVITGGNLAGTVNHTTGEVEVEYTAKLPDMETLVTVTYEQELPSGGAPTSMAGDITVTDPSDIAIPLGASSEIAPKGLRMRAPMQLSPGIIVPVDMADNGTGGVVTLDQSFAAPRGKAWIAGGQVVGAVNYTTGQITLDPAGVSYDYYAWDFQIGKWFIANPG
jgi:hypothetical protein